MLKNFYKSAARRWVAVFLSGLFALGIIFSERERVFQSTGRPHIGHERRGGSDIIIVNAPSMYTNASVGMFGDTWRPGSMVPTIILPSRS